MADEDGYLVILVMTHRNDIQSFFQLVQRYYALHTPRIRLRALDSNTRFWVKWSPFRYLQFLDLTLTGPLIGQGMTAGEVGSLGRDLSWVPLLTLTLRTREVDSLFNGVVQWPCQPKVTGLVLEFTRNCPSNEWKKPCFPHLLRPFPALTTLELRCERFGNPFTPRLRPHPLFTVYAEGFTYITRKRGETSDMTVRRVASNVLKICKHPGRFGWNERRYVGSAWVSEEVVSARDEVTGVWGTGQPGP